MSHPGPNGGNVHSFTNSGAFNSGPQDADLQSSCPRPRPLSRPQPPSAAPVFYVHAPTAPPPPAFHYPWPLPMPLFFNPLEGFPGMGYGIFMPPFPPYMETPAYIMPPPHVQPMDYRRLLHPQAHVPTAAHQNTNQMRRTRPPRGASTETVNAAVQTELTERHANDYGDRSPLVLPDSGHGTTSVSPSSSSSSKRRDAAEANDFKSLEQKVRNLMSSNGDVQINDARTKVPLKPSFNVQHPTRSVGTSIRAILDDQKNHKEGSAQTNDGHCKVWSVSSSDSIVPVCSSSQQDDVFRERLSSICGVQKLLPSESPNARDKCVDQLPGEDDSFAKDCECLYKILKLPLVRSREDAHEMSSGNFQTRKKVNESVWSVDSLPLYIPTKEWLAQNGLIDTVAIEEEEVGNCQAARNFRIVNTPKRIGDAHEMFSSNFQTKKFNESVWSVESLPPFIPTKEWLAQNGLFGPVAIEEEELGNCQSAQNVRNVNTGKRIGNAFSENEATLPNSPTLERIVQNAVDVEAIDGNGEQLCVPVDHMQMAEVSPRGHLVDCGIQCDQIQCFCEKIRSSRGTCRRNLLRPSGVKSNNGGSKVFCMNGSSQKNQNSPENLTGQQMSHDGLPGQTGKRGEHGSTALLTVDRTRNRFP
ncbi:uncharacterized protein LOC114844041 [Betta splendens]|uniref:Uncharacterized protein LOC114844041 n=1 Tax=Betta splendens TaxID=158456 RepID=A0A6P7KWP9_BETSP|nr:uncharacterized protein LOC114844041 [Betta splendens]